MLNPVTATGRHPDRRGGSFSRLAGALASALLLLLGVLSLSAAPAAAGNSNHGEPQVTVNPGGGVLTDGSDGVKLDVNNANGYDQIHYKNTTQYCCGAVAPALNIGGTLYGEAGAATSSASWTDVEIVSTSGSTTTAGGTATGNGSAVLRYTVTHGGRSYELLRTITYTFPNTYINEEFQVTVPAGNTDTVKLYHGGDTAPGGSDTGNGVMVTSPVRTVYSVNPVSEIQIGYGEVPGQTAFDGAVSGHYSAPYGTVQAGGDIGFSVNTSNHDAGLMVQWTIGATPGVHQRALRTYIGARGASLSSTLSATDVRTDGSVDLNLQILNTASTTETGLGYGFQLPAGLVLGSASPANTCGGALTASAGGTTVTLSGVSVVAAGSCLVTVPVTAAASGAYQFSSGSVTSVTGLENLVGTSTLTVLGTPVLTASVDPDQTRPGVPVDLGLTLTNPNGSAESGLGYTVGLPTGLTLGSAAPTTTCGGTLTASGGGSSVSLTGASVTAAGSCQVTVPVQSTTIATYQLTNASVTAVTGVARNLGTISIGVAEPGLCPSLQGWTVLSDQVQRLYRSLMGRSADSEGQLYWTRARLAGLPAAELADLLLASSERLGHHGDLDDGAFVERLYLDALGRTAESDGRAYWVGRLGGGLSRPSLVLAISDSAESVNRTGTLAPLSDARAQVCRLYRTVLNRTPDVGGLDHWSDQLAAGRPAAEVATAMLAQPEAASLSQLPAATFVDRLYLQSALARAADTAGKEYWAALAGLSGRGPVALWLSNQLEALPT